MCLGIPMQVIAVDGYLARCSAQGIEREVSLFLLQDEAVATDDFVMVHVGYAIQKMTAQQARSAWELYAEMLAAERADDYARTRDLPGPDRTSGRSSGRNCPPA